LCVAAVPIAALGRHGIDAWRSTVDEGRLQYQATHQLGLLLQDPRLPPMPGVPDLGETSYLLDHDVLDLDGLASLDIFQALRARTWNEATFRIVAGRHGTRTAIVWSDILARVSVPAEWTRLGSWHTADGPTYVFFAADADAARALAAALVAFDARLPAGVWRTGFP